MEFLEQDSGKLAGGIQVELLSGNLINFLGESTNFSFRFLGHLLEQVTVHLDPMLLHASEHRNQRQFDFFKQFPQLLFLKLRKQNILELKGEIGLLAQDLRRLLSKES